MDSASILVVDDEPGITLLCKRLLTRARFEVMALTDPRQAVVQMQQKPFDLLLVDIRMPEVDGFAVIAHAKRLQPDMAVLVMTGFGTVETAIRALRQGVDGLILKPFEQGEELVQSVRQALADSQAKRDVARIQALRPLFNVIESLLAETQPDRLLELIVNAICGHLHCASAGYYQYYSGEPAPRLLAGKGKVFVTSKDGEAAAMLREVDRLNSPLLVNASGPGDEASRLRIANLGLGAAMFVPITQRSGRSVLFAGRDASEPPFRQADLEMFLILTRQAVIAMENARLYAELRDYVRRVEESQQALLQAEKIASAGRLTATIAHEVNNPLQAVQNCLHLAGREDLPAEKRKEYFEMARTELDNLMQTVQKTLEFYRPGGLTAQRVRLGELLQRVLDLLSQQISERDVCVQTNIPADLPAVNVVASQIQQVFMNLILNALDAMPRGGNLRVKARPVKGGVEIVFTDSGPGVPEESQGRIFEPFYSTKEGGTGLGLTVSYNIVASHGGALELVPAREAGASFRIFLPVGGQNETKRADR